MPESVEQVPWWRRDVSDIRFNIFPTSTTYSRAELCAETDRRRCDHAAHKQVGDQVRLYGIVTSIALPAGSGVSFSATFDDGTAVVNLLFVGQSRREDLHPGTQAEVSGVLEQDSSGRLTLRNPDYVVAAEPAQT